MFANPRRGQGFDLGGQEVSQGFDLGGQEVS